MSNGKMIPEVIAGIAIIIKGRSADTICIKKILIELTNKVCKRYIPIAEKPIRASILIKNRWRILTSNDEIPIQRKANDRLTINRIMVERNTMECEN